MPPLAATTAPGRFFLRLSVARLESVSHQRGVGFGVGFGVWQESLEGDAFIENDDVHRCATSHKSLILFGWVSQVLVFSSFFPALA